MVHQTIRWESAAAALIAGQHRPLTPWGISGGPYHVNKQFYFYPVMSKIQNWINNFPCFWRHLTVVLNISETHNVLNVTSSWYGIVTSQLWCLTRWFDPLLWRNNGWGSVSNHQPHHCLLNRFFRRRSKKTSKLRVTGLCAGNSPGTRKMFPFDDVIMPNDSYLRQQLRWLC